MTTKRSIAETELDSISSMATCLMLLSRGHGHVPSSENSNYPNRVFECKTCDRQFSSFQALGGHRASHKKPKTAAMAGDNTNESSTARRSPPSKPKTHECSICGLEFSIGQALGGHMRRHRAAASMGNSNSNSNNTVNLTLLNGELGVVPAKTQVPVVRKSNSRRVLWLDLNLTPRENDLKLQMIKPSTTPIFFYL